MNETLRHRGPDSAGTLVDGPVALASRRLSIIDLAGGDQPIGNEDGSIQVVQNGEIYNHLELRATLERRGHRFRTASDTEVHLHLYEEYGPHYVRELRGMFAVALWDSKRRRLVLARDAFGIKPLYYSTEGGTLAFASELKALPAARSTSTPSRPSSPSTRSRRRFRSGRGRRSFLPATCSSGKARASRQWSATRGPAPVPAGEVRTEDENELAEELRARLRDSVRAHLLADVPVGVLLSGGVDSGALAALAALESGKRVQTFSIGFEEGSFDELADARKVAELYDTDHHELVVRPDAAELLPKLAEAFDEPFADSSALPTYLVSELAARDVKVALSGEGGDELFGGYYTYVADLLAPKIGPLAERHGRSSSACRAPPPGRASTTGRSASSGRRTCHRSSATTAGRRSSRRRRARPCSSPTGAAAPIRSTSIGRVTRRRKAPRSSRACRTSTSASTSSTTCS